MSGRSALDIAAETDYIAMELSEVQEAIQKQLRFLFRSKSR